jgi:hypothetical protein
LRSRKGYGKINTVNHQVIKMAVIIHLVKTSGCFLGMIAVCYSIPVTGQGFMEELTRHIAQGKNQDQK